MRHYAAAVGIPSGRSFAALPAFGIYTRLTARGFQVWMLWCTRTATSALDSEVSGNQLRGQAVVSAGRGAQGCPARASRMACMGGTALSLMVIR